jgi:hypothetical protein
MTIPSGKFRARTIGNIDEQLAATLFLSKMELSLIHGFEGDSMCAAPPTTSRI